MQDISIQYRKLMRIGSIVSLSFLIFGLLIHVVLLGDTVHVWNWRNSYVYLMIGIISLLLTPIAGLLTFLIYTFKQEQYQMFFLVFTLLILLIGGTWIIHFSK